MPTSLPLFLEDIEGVFLLFALDLPGCFAEGGSEAEALSSFPAALADYCAWLAAHGESEPAARASIRVAERIESYRLADGYEVNALFAPERSPPDQHFLDQSLRLLRASGADFSAAVRSIPVEEWDEPLGTGERTVRQVVDHVIRAEAWYLSHFADSTRLETLHQTPDPLVRFDLGRAALIAWLMNAPSDRLALVIQEEEEWTARKLIRRTLWHERTHRAEIGHRTGA